MFLFCIILILLLIVLASRTKKLFSFCHKVERLLSHWKLTPLVAKRLSVPEGVKPSRESAFSLRVSVSPKFHLARANLPQTQIRRFGSWNFLLLFVLAFRVVLWQKSPRLTGNSELLIAFSSRRPLRYRYKSRKMVLKSVDSLTMNARMNRDDCCSVIRSLNDQTVGLERETGR